MIKETSLYINVQDPNFVSTLSIPSSTVSLQSSVTTDIIITPINGFTGLVEIIPVSSSIPQGINITGVNNLIIDNEVSKSAPLTITVSSNMSSGTHEIPFLIKDTTYGIIKTETFILSVLQPDFSFSLNPTSATTDVGTSVTTTITITPIQGFTGNVNIAVEGSLPNGITMNTLGTINITDSSRSKIADLIFNIGNNVLSGTYSIVLRATNPLYNITKTATFTITVNSPDFSFSLNPTSATTNINSTITTTATITPVRRFQGSVSITVEGSLPNGITVNTINLITITDTNSKNTSIVFNIGSNVTSGNHTITLKATNTTHNISKITTFTIFINIPNFSFSLNPTSVTTNINSTTTTTATITPSQGFLGTVNISIDSVLPNGITVNTINSITITDTNSKNTSIVFNIGSSVMIGNHVITLKATNTIYNITKTTTFTISINSPDFSFSLNPTSATTNVNSSVTTIATITPVRDFLGDINITVDGTLPSNITVNNINTITVSPSSGSRSTNIVFNIGSNVTPGNHVITLKATNTTYNITKTTTFTINLNSVDFNVTALPTSFSDVIVNSTINTTLVITPVNGFTGIINRIVFDNSTPSGLILTNVNSNQSINITNSSTINEPTSWLVSSTGSNTSYSVRLRIECTAQNIIKYVTLNITIAQSTFNVAITPSSINTPKGSSITPLLTITPVNRFNDFVEVSLLNPPLGITMTTFNADVRNTTYSSSITISIASTFSSTSTTLTIQCMDVTTRTIVKTVTLNIIIQSIPSNATFTPLLLPSISVTTKLNTTVSRVLSIRPENGFLGTVNIIVYDYDSTYFSIVSPPANSITITDQNTKETNVTIYVKEENRNNLNTKYIAFKCTSGSIVKYVTMIIDVKIEDFEIEIDPSTCNVDSINKTANAILKVIPYNDFTGVVSTTISPDYAGFTIQPINNITITDTNSKTTSISIIANMPVYGRLYNFIVQSKNTTYNIVKEKPFDIFAIVVGFNIFLDPASHTVTSYNTQITTNVILTAINSFSSIVNLSVTGLPTGVTTSFSRSSFVLSFIESSTLTFNIGTSVPQGSHNIAVVATGGGITKQANFELIINTASSFSFNISLNPTSATVTTTTTIVTTVFTVTPINGFTGTVNIVVSSTLPSGVTVSTISPVTITDTNSKTTNITFNISNSLANGTFNIKINATNTIYNIIKTADFTLIKNITTLVEVYSCVDPTTTSDLTLGTSSNPFFVYPGQVISNGKIPLKSTNYSGNVSLTISPNNSSYFSSLPTITNSLSIPMNSMANALVNFTVKNTLSPNTNLELRINGTYDNNKTFAHTCYLRTTFYMECDIDVPISFKQGNTFVFSRGQTYAISVYVSNKSFGWSETVNFVISGCGVNVSNSLIVYASNYGSTPATKAVNITIPLSVSLGSNTLSCNFTTAISNQTCSISKSVNITL